MRPASIVGVDINETAGLMTIRLDDGFVIGPLPLPYFSAADLMAVLEGPDASADWRCLDVQ